VLKKSIKGSFIHSFIHTLKDKTYVNEHLNLICVMKILGILKYLKIGGKTI
jgi:hypothetical protein